MCRPPCCNNTGGQGAGIAAVAFIIGAALVAAKIGPVVAGIVHTVVEVIRLVALTVGSVVALAVVTWAVLALIRWQLRRQALAVTRTGVVTMPSWERTGPADRADCLACGGAGTVLRAISGGQYQPGECPVCEPVRRAG
jgi:hypothetical protein